MSKHPNILLISIDSLRPDHLSLYGYHKETSPNLELFAAQGIIYENAFSAANWTGAAVSSLLTGLYPTCHGYTNRRYYLDPDVESIATLLQRAGFYTICFSNNLYISHKTGMSQGFDKFLYQGKEERQDSGKDLIAKESRLAAKLKNVLPARPKSLLKDVLDHANHKRMLTRDKGAFKTETAFKKWFNRYNGEKPFFAYIHYQEPHSVYFPPFPFRRRFFSGSWVYESKYLDFDLIDFFGGKVEFTEQQINHYKELYDGEIAYLDWRLGRLLDYLKHNRVLDNTVVIVTADHGENMGENGYFWHAFCLYDSLIRIPLIIRYPEWFASASLSSELVQIVDIVPTLADGLNLNWPFSKVRQGESLLAKKHRSAVLVETFSAEKMVKRWLKRRNDLEMQDFQQYFRDLVAYRTNKYKLIKSSDGGSEFYDLENDPLEGQNLYHQDDPRVIACEKKLDEWTGTFSPHVADETQPGFDKDTWEKMKALGYA
ncbi:sulfatase [candidate division KSB1 bacterium]|nr:sulfatase [candidate division KSB1 bacterium]